VNGDGSRTAADCLHSAWFGRTDIAGGPLVIDRPARVSLAALVFAVLGGLPDRLRTNLFRIEAVRRLNRWSQAVLAAEGSVGDQAEDRVD